MQVTVNVVKLVSIVTLQGFCYFRNFREKETIFSVGGGRFRRVHLLLWKWPRDR